MAAAPVYTQTILSLHQKYPVRFPAHFINLNFDRGLAAGTAIEPADLQHAEAVVMALRGHNGEIL